MLYLWEPVLSDWQSIIEVFLWLCCCCCVLRIRFTSTTMDYWFWNNIFHRFIISGFVYRSSRVQVSIFIFIIHQSPLVWKWNFADTYWLIGSGEVSQGYVARVQARNAYGWGPLSAAAELDAAPLALAGRPHPVALAVAVAVLAVLVLAVAAAVFISTSILIARIFFSKNVKN